MTPSDCPGRILIVEDDPASSQLLTFSLQGAGFTVLATPDGRQALKVIDEFRPDAIMLDLMMPGRDGFELCRLIRTNPRTAKATVIMVTALHDKDTRKRGMDCGAHDFLTKPLEPDDVVLRVSNAVQLKRLSELLDRRTRELESVKKIQWLRVRKIADQFNEMLRELEDPIDYIPIEKNVSEFVGDQKVAPVHGKSSEEIPAGGSDPATEGRENPDVARAAGLSGQLFTSTDSKS